MCHERIENNDTCSVLEKAVNVFEEDNIVVAINRGGHVHNEDGDRLFEFVDDRFLSFVAGTEKGGVELVV
jgi:hypothetical protein